jgi:hypothetical protein
LVQSQLVQRRFIQGGVVLTRDLGQRRISAVTTGLVAASVAGTLAAGVAAYAKSSDDNPAGDSPGPTPTPPAPGATGAPPPAQPAATQSAPVEQPAPPPGDITEGGATRHATSGGT